jgi:hypothetical protein
MLALVPFLCGSGAAVAHTSSSAATGVLSLDGSDWRLSRDGPDADGGGGVVTAPVENASVPGGVWDNLYRAGRVGDPLYRDNDLVFANATTAPGGVPVVWTFSKEFDCPAAGIADPAPGSTVVLEFDGIQTLANISLNGKAVLSATNMFRRQRAVLPAGLLRARHNQLTVALASTPYARCATTIGSGKWARCAYASGTPTPAPRGVRDENDAWGWDWSPNLDPISIWKGPVRIVAPDHAAMPHLASWSPKITVSPRQRHARKWRYRS